jgi:hypothetical protein
MHDIGLIVTVSASPSSAYHKIHGDKVTVIGNCEYKDEIVCTFEHPTEGVGALYERGLKVGEFRSISNEWGQEESKKKAMFTKFVNQKLNIIGSCVDLNSNEVLTCIHPSLGFIAVKTSEIENDKFVGTR